MLDKVQHGKGGYNCECMVCRRAPLFVYVHRSLHSYVHYQHDSIHWIVLPCHRNTCNLVVSLLLRFDMLDIAILHL